MEQFLEVQKYLRSGKPLVSLAGDPWNLIIREEGNLVLLKYNQINSDFNEPICRECRGLILDKRTWQVVCLPFFKFFNYEEEYADKLDDSELYVYQKIDGSLAKVWYYEGVWRLSTNGMIDASEVLFENSISFQSLFMRALTTYGLTWEEFVKPLDKNYTYMYELATQDNPVVVKYQGYHLFYLGQRNINTYQEEYTPDSRIENVKIYDFKTIDDIVANAKELPPTEEGYVVRDKNFNRVKIKSPTYFLLHRAAANGKPDLVRYVLENDYEEFLVYFPEYRPKIEKIKAQFIKLAKMAKIYKDSMKIFYSKPRKEFATILFNKGVPKYLQTFIFKTYENHDLSWKEYTKEWDIIQWKSLYDRAESDLIV